MNWFHQKILGLFVKTKGIISKPIYGGKGHVLMMHRILPKKLVENSPFNHGLAITPEKLEEVILLYKHKKYDFISIDELKCEIKNKKRTKPFVCFTIDDGYKDNITYGLPIFEKHKIPFCIYVTTCFPDNTATFWWYLLEEYVQKNNRIEFEVNNEKFRFNWNTNGELISIYPKIKNAIKQVKTPVFRTFIMKVFNLSDGELRTKANRLSLTWEDVKLISENSLVTIGNHTLNHSSLSKLTKEEVNKEIIEANKILYKRTGLTIRHFAYPYGGRNDVNKKVSNVLKNIPDIETAVLNLPGNISTSTLETLELIPRYPIGESFNLQKLENQENGILHFSNNGFNKKIQLD